MDEILAATKGGPRVGAFGPAADGRVVFDNYNERREKGIFARKPMLVGNTNNEGGLYEMLGQPNAFGAKRPGIYCLSHNTASARHAHGVPVWRYLYSAEWPNHDIGKPGAWHGSDVGMWFGTGERLTHVPDTEVEKRFVEMMMNAWTGFARDPVGGLGKLGWPGYDGGEGAKVIRLGGNNDGSVGFGEHRIVDDGPQGC